MRTAGDTVDLSTLTCSTISLATGVLRVSVDNLSLQGSGANMNLTRLTHVATQTATPAAGIGAGFTGSWYDPA